jgi:hypothetical protein
MLLFLAGNGTSVAQFPSFSAIFIKIPRSGARPVFIKCEE